MRLKAVFSDYQNHLKLKWSNFNTVLSHWRSRQKNLPVHSEKLVSVHRLKRQTHQIVSKRFSSRMCIQKPFTLISQQNLSNMQQNYLKRRPRSKLSQFTSGSQFNWVKWKLISLSHFSLVGGFFEGTRENILHIFRA